MTRRPSRTDIALAAAVCAELVIEMLLMGARRGPLAANLVAAIALGAPLVWRRAAPLAAIAAVGAVGIVMGATLTHPQDLVGTFAALGLATSRWLRTSRAGARLPGSPSRWPSS